MGIDLNNINEYGMLEILKLLVNHVNLGQTQADILFLSIQLIKKR